MMKLKIWVYNKKYTRIMKLPLKNAKTENKKEKKPAKGKKWPGLRFNKKWRMRKDLKQIKWINNLLKD